MSGVSVYCMEFNLGFAEANNRAFKESDATLLAVLNPDAFPEPEWLEQLVSESQLYPDVAAFGSKQMMYEGNGLLDGVGDVYHISGIAWRSGVGKMSSARNELPGEIFSACAAGALYRAEVLKEVGGFDEDYFCYLEDVDLGFRLRLAGYSARYVPSAVVHHIGSATSGGRRSDFSLYHGHRNLVWTFVKNMPGFLFWLLLPVLLTQIIILISVCVFRGNIKVLLRSYLIAIKGLPRMWRKRKKIQGKRVAPVSDIWKVLDKSFFRD